MSERRAQTGLGLSDHIPDPEILTKEIDHDFFDDPPEATSSIDFTECQQQRDGARSGDMPNKEGDGSKVEADSTQVSTSFPEQNGARLDNSFRKVKDYYDELTNESGRSSSNMTVHLEVGQINGLIKGVGGGEERNGLGLAGAVPASEAEAGFYSIHESNATSPNYPRPKQCYQLQQQRRSIGSIKKPLNLSGEHGSMEQMLYPMNSGDCDLGGIFADDEMISSSSDGSVVSSSDSDLSDSSESELESLESDDEELVDMLEKYFDYIDTGSDCSDLTEVSPLSSLTTSPLPPLFPGGGNGEPAVDMEAVSMLADLQLAAENKLCSSPVGKTGFLVEPANSEGLSIRAADIVYDRPTSEKAESMSADYGKPKLPLFISTTESIIVPEDGLIGKAGDEDDEDPPTTLEELKGKDTNGGQLASFDFGLPDNKVLDKDDKAIPSSGVQGAGKAQCISDASVTSFNFSNSSVPSKDESFSRSSSSTAGWSVSSSGVDNGDKARTNSSSSTSGTSSNGSSSRVSGLSGGFKRPPKNYTFTPDQMRRIERENHILLRKILDANSRNQHFHQHDHRHRSGHGGHHARHHHKPVTFTSKARLQQQKRIEQENNMLMKRLQTVKPSKEIEEAFEKPVARN